MKRTFALTHPKIKVDRLVEAAKSDIRKYLKRERKQELPEDVDFWDFACRCGPSVYEAVPTHVDDLGKCIAKAAAENRESIFVEVVTKPGRRMKKPADSKRKTGPKKPK